MQVLPFEFLKFRIFKILNFHPCVFSWLYKNAYPPSSVNEHPLVVPISVYQCQRQMDQAFGYCAAQTIDILDVITLVPLG